MGKEFLMVKTACGKALGQERVWVKEQPGGPCDWSQQGGWGDKIRAVTCLSLLALDFPVGFHTGLPVASLPPPVHPLQRTRGIFLKYNLLTPPFQKPFQGPHYSQDKVQILWPDLQGSSQLVHIHFCPYPPHDLSVRTTLTFLHFQNTKVLLHSLAGLILLPCPLSSSCLPAASLLSLHHPHPLQAALAAPSSAPKP